MIKKKWIAFIDGTTIFWLGFFIIGLLAFDSDLFGFKEPIIKFPDEIKYYWDIFSWMIWLIFVIDLYFKYRGCKNWKVFLKKHWFDIILLFPFFRVLRIFRLFRLLKTLKLLKVGLSFYKAYGKSKRFDKK